MPLESRLPCRESPLHTELAANPVMDKPLRHGRRPAPSRRRETTANPIQPLKQCAIVQEPAALSSTPVQAPTTQLLHWPKHRQVHLEPATASQSRLRLGHEP